MKTINFLIISLLLISCSKDKTNIQFSGEAQGTTYQVIYVDDDDKKLQPAIDSVFKVIDKSMSLWDSTSIISRINKNDTTVEVDIHFAVVFRKSKEISEKTNGAFDITVAPLVKGWGFGLNKAAEMDTIMVDSLRQLVDYTSLSLEDGKVIRRNDNVQIDFNAIAQGYTVDVIANFLEDKKIKNYLIEVGGELRASGKKADGSEWKVGIDKPVDNSNEQNRELQIIINLKNKSLATSGNYRKFYEKNGQKFSHTIDPFTGYPVTHNLLSVSVITDDCMSADAYATAFMVMGVEEAKKFVSLNKGIEVYLVFAEGDELKTWASQGFEKHILE